MQPTISPADKEQALRLWKRHAPTAQKKLLEATELQNAE